MENILELESIVKHYTRKNIFGTIISTVKAVDNVSFNLKKGNVFVLAGESGSGKSTIANLILNPDLMDSGKLRFEGKEINHDKNNIKKIHHACQTIQQNPFDAINPKMKIYDILKEPLVIHKINKSEIKSRILQVLKDVGLEPPERFVNLYPHVLSGGQKQRVVLARAIGPKPKIIIADEPVSMLDVSMRAGVLNIMNTMRLKYGITFLYITHDLATAKHFGHDIGIMYKGKIVELGDIDKILSNPSHPYTQMLINAISEPDPSNLLKNKNKIKFSDQKLDGCNFRSNCSFAIEKCKNEPNLEKIQNDTSVACFVDKKDQASR